MNIYLSIICAINIYLSVAVPLNLMPKNETIGIHNSFLQKFMKSPTAFIAQMNKADPETLEEILGLLRGLLTTSADRETHLIDVLNAANTALDTANGDVTTSAGLLTDAKTWHGEAENDVTAAELDLAAKEAIAAKKQTEKNDAQGNHDDEIDTLNEEQEMIEQVIQILHDLLDRQPCVGGQEVTIGSSTPNSVEFALPNGLHSCDNVARNEQNPNWTDTFTVSEVLGQPGTVKITRSDEAVGWGQQLVLSCCP